MAARSIASAHRRLCANLANPERLAGWPRGVIGAVTARGDPLYAYPEIAGYWLHWASTRGDVSDATGSTIVAWLRDLRKHTGCWPTRIAVADSVDAVYSESRYLFDHAMLWDGLTCWTKTRGDEDARRLADLLWNDLHVFFRGGSPRARVNGLTARWSGRGGPFLLKVAARFRGQYRAPAPTCARLAVSWEREAMEQPHCQAHPQLYAIEGLIILDHITNARAALAQLLSSHGGPLGLRESVGQGPRRSDILAQALRAGLLSGLIAPSDHAWQALAHELAERVDDEGRLPFAEPGDDCPTWAALFAEQALARWLGGDLQAGDLV